MQAPGSPSIDEAVLPPDAPPGHEAYLGLNYWLDATGPLSATPKRQKHKMGKGLGHTDSKTSSGTYIITYIDT